MNTLEKSFIDICNIEYIDNQTMVYILECNGMFKVGISKNIKTRLKQVQCGNPYKVILKKAYSMAYHQLAFNAEKRIHDRLKKDNLHIRLEWFKKFDISIADDIIKNTF